MIDLATLPQDITQHILFFRDFLNISWDHVIYNLMNQHDWDNDGDLIDDWMQVNWELLLERELLGKDLTLTQFSTTHLTKNILKNDIEPNFMVICKPKNNSMLDAKSNKEILNKGCLRLFSLKTKCSKSNSFSFGPPFEIACLIDVETSELYHVLFDKVYFVLYRAHVDYNK